MPAAAAIVVGAIFLLTIILANVDIPDPTDDPVTLDPDSGLVFGQRTGALTPTVSGVSVTRTQSAGAADAERQVSEFCAQQTVIEAKNEASSRQREAVLSEVERRAGENRVIIEAERQARTAERKRREAEAASFAERERPVNAACARTDVKRQVAEFRGEELPELTTRLLEICAIQNREERVARAQLPLAELAAERRRLEAEEAAEAEAERRRLETAEAAARAEEDRRLQAERERAAAEEAVRIRRANTVTALTLIDAYDSNQIAADANYLGRRLWVTGFFYDVGETLVLFGDPELYVEVSADRSDFVAWTVRCLIPDTAANRSQVAGLLPGDPIVVIGTVDGEGFLSVQLRTCQVVS